MSTILGRLNVHNRISFVVVCLILHMSCDVLAADFSIKATPTGTPSNLTLNINVQPDQSNYGQLGSFFVAAQLPSSVWYYLTTNGWQWWNPTKPLPPYITTTLQATNNFTPIVNMDVSAYPGAIVYAGYGTSMTSMLNAKTYNSIYSVPGIPPASFYVSASTGPLAYLSSAQITIKNNTGAVIGQGTTNSQGMAYFQLPGNAVAQGPLQIEASGGRANGQSFQGVLSAEASGVAARAYTPIIYLDLISTSAKILERNGYNYGSAVKAVRSSLGIGNRQADGILRYKNNHVDDTKLRLAVLKNKGFNPYAQIVANSAALGMPVIGLKPSQSIAISNTSRQSSLFDSTSRPRAQSQSTSAQASTSSSASPICTTQASTGSNSSTSTTVITDTGAIASSVLLQYVGLSATAANGITGMLFSFIPTGTSPTTEALQNIATELSCIETQLAAINDELEELQFTEDLSLASQCIANALESDWTTYTGLVTGNVDTPQNINSSNPNVIAAYAQFQPLTGTVCGSDINNSLFGTPGNPGAAAWPAFNAMYQQDYNWYTQQQTQGIQSWLSYYSTYLYYQFVLTNEVWNYTGAFIDAQSSAGSIGDGSSGCANNASPSSFCVQQANIQNAFPGDLYSDEIGIWQSGLAVNAYPGGSAVGQGSQGLNVYYLADLYYPYATAFESWSYPASTLSQSAVSSFNNQGINPAGNPSAVETFTSPQALRTTTVSSSQVNGIITLPQSANGQTPFNSVAAPNVAWNTFFLNAINQVGGSNSWSGLTSSQVGFYTSDNVTTGSWQDPGTYQLYDSAPTTIHFGNFAGNSSATVTCSGFNYPWCPASSNVPPPIMGVLLGRNWWPNNSAGIAPSSYTYATLPAPMTVPSQPGLVNVTGGPGQISVAFNAPTSLGNPATLLGYEVSCTASTGPTITGTGVSSPISVYGLTSGTSYSCSVQAQNQAGYSAPSGSANATPSSATVPGPPLITASYYYTESPYTYIFFDWTAPSYTGGASITDYYGTCTSATGVVTQQSIGTPGSNALYMTLPAQQNSNYSCYVQAYNSFGLGANSNTVTPTLY